MSIWDISKSLRAFHGGIWCGWKPGEDPVGFVCSRLSQLHKIAVNFQSCWNIFNTSFVNISLMSEPMSVSWWEAALGLYRQWALKFTHTPRTSVTKYIYNRLCFVNDYAELDLYVSLATGSRVTLQHNPTTQDLWLFINVLQLILLFKCHRTWF